MNRFEQPVSGRAPKVNWPGGQEALNGKGQMKIKFLLKIVKSKIMAKKSKSTQEKAAKPEQVSSSENPKAVKAEQIDSGETKSISEIQQKIEETQLQNSQEEQQTLKAIDDLSDKLFSVVGMAAKKSEMSALKQSVADLNSLINAIKVATAVSMQPGFEESKIANDPNVHDCGCGEPKVKSCCVEIFGSGIRVLKSTWDDGPKLELMVAIEAKGFKALFPGLSSTIVVDKNAGWTKTYWPVTRCCVPCDQNISVPITVEAIDMDKALGGNPEYGVTTGCFIPVNCNCNICSIRVEVPLKGGGLTKNALVEIEVSARRVEGACCC